MVTYASDELIPSSEFAKKFGTYLSKIRNSTVEKLAILKNNKVEAVLISKDEYESMKEILEHLENEEIYNTIKERTSKPYKSITHEEMLKEFNIDVNDLKD